MPASCAQAPKLQAMCACFKDGRLRTRWQCALQVTGDVISIYWAMIFGETSEYVPKPDCSIFHCEGHASSS